MKRKKLLKYIVPIFGIILLVTAWFGVKQAAGAVRNLKEIEAFYGGRAVEVGEAIRLEDIYVTATYRVNDGYYETTEYEDVKNGYTISPTVITKEGDNKVTVTYRGKTDVIIVEGKVVEGISAEYIGNELYVGATIPAGKVEVYAYFSDGSQEQVRGFELAEATVQKEGMNMIPVVYKGKMEYIYVYGKAPLAIEEILAFYVGDSIIVGNPISKNKIQVEVLYNDGTVKKVTNFNISPSIVEEEGLNEITVTYGNESTIIEVYGEERFITEMSARYTGPGVILGERVPKEEIEVIVKYNDGSEEETEEFELLGDEILYEGENSVLVYCDAFAADVVVYGVKGFAANFDSVVSNFFISQDYSAYTEVTLGINPELEPGKFALKTTDYYMVRNAVQRIIPTEEFIGFELAYDDDEMVLQFPMAMKVSVPDGYEPEKFGVYYTPNRSTIMAKVNGHFIDEEQTEYEFVVYEPGVYILIHEVSNRLVSEIIVETEVKLKENRSFSLNPVVFPLSADNREVTFYSTDENVASVSPNGKIRSYNEGTCEIWVEATDGSGVYAIVTVEVSNGKTRR